MTKARKFHGVECPAEPTAYLVDLSKKDSVLIHREESNGEVKICKNFLVGDVAEYDSYNLVYTGTIKKITEKSVTIVERCGTVHRLSMNEFCWRNYNFDAVRVADENQKTSHYI
jgi:hypothetical protein